MLLTVGVSAQQGVYGTDSEYEDTEFGELLYNEASVPTRLEILSLLSKETPSVLVFMHALSMGLGIDDVLDAAVRYQPNKARDLTESAITLLPLLTESTEYLYSTFELEDIDKDDRINFDGNEVEVFDEDNETYSVRYIAKKFFEDRSVLVPYADWHDGQFHFEASATELFELSKKNSETKWYRNRSTNSDSNRPIFVSLYEFDSKVLVDNVSQIEKALAENGNDAKLPIVVVYNRTNERPIDQLGYPLTLRGVQKAYTENILMATPSPEWEKGEHHIIAQFEEIYEIFDIPEEDDFEPEHWQRLLLDAEKYNGTDPAFIVVVLPSASGNELSKINSYSNNQLLAAYRDPRIDESLPYVIPNNNEYNDENSNENDRDNEESFLTIMAKGLVINRPDLIAGLNALGVTEVPIAFYYLDKARTKPFVRGPRVLHVIGLNRDVPTTPPPPNTPPRVASPPRNN